MIRNFTSTHTKHRKTRSIAAALALWLFLPAALTSCSSKSLSMSDNAGNMTSSWKGEEMYAETSTEMDVYDYGMMEAETMAEPMASPAEAFNTAKDDSAVSADTVQNDLSARKLIKNANMNVETKDFDAFMQTLSEKIAASGGYQSSSSISGNSYGSKRGGERYASLTIRIPTDRYETFVSGIASYGNVTYRSENVNDVTMAYVDTESRIKAYEAEYTTLLDILAKAETLSDVIVIQNRITEVTYELESYRAQLRKYDDLVSYCTVYLDVREVVELTEIVEPPVTLGERMSRGLKETCDDIARGAENFAVWFVSSLPVLLIDTVGIVIAVVVLRVVIRYIKKKRKNREKTDKKNQEQNKE